MDLHDVALQVLVLRVHVLVAAWNAYDEINVFIFLLCVKFKLFQRIFPFFFASHTIDINPTIRTARTASSSSALPYSSLPLSVCCQLRHKTLTVSHALNNYVIILQV